MLTAYYRLLKPFLLPSQRSPEEEQQHNELDDETKELDLLLNTLITGQHPNSKNFMRFARRYNKEFACGTITTISDPVPGGYQVVKLNGNVTFQMSGLHPPTTLNEDGEPLHKHLCGQVWTLDPDEAIYVRQARNDEDALGLSVSKFFHVLL